MKLHFLLTVVNKLEIETLELEVLIPDFGLGSEKSKHMNHYSVSTISNSFFSYLDFFLKFTSKVSIFISVFELAFELAIATLGHLNLKLDNYNSHGTFL